MREDWGACRSGRVDHDGECLVLDTTGAVHRDELLLDVFTDGVGATLAAEPALLATAERVPQALMCSRARVLETELSASLKNYLVVVLDELARTLVDEVTDRVLHIAGLIEARCFI